MTTPTSSPTWTIACCTPPTRIEAESPAEFIKPWNKVCARCLKMVGSNRKQECCGVKDFKKPSDPWLNGKAIIYPENAKPPTKKCKSCRKPLVCNNALTCKACGAVQRLSNKDKDKKRKRNVAEKLLSKKKKKATVSSPPVLVRKSSLVPLGSYGSDDAANYLDDEYARIGAQTEVNGANAVSNGDDWMKGLDFLDFGSSESEFKQTGALSPALSRQSSLREMWEAAPIDYVSTSGFDYEAQYVQGHQEVSI